ncbi:MAG: hypothetical protein HYY06_30325 [Deltaproteobacteria bacterium]|nr:hypothetical protein [Deltaproteobacteria bacterium]
MPGAAPSIAALLGPGGPLARRVSIGECGDGAQGTCDPNRWIEGAYSSLG